MSTMIVEPVVQNLIPSPAKRVSWGAIFGGVTVALVTQLLLGVLGLAIGASTIDPLRANTPTQGLGIGTGIWFLLTGLLSLFAGGWTAGRLAGVPRAIDSALHGVLTWGIATLLTFYLLTTAVGAIMGGAARALGQGASAVGQGMAAASPGVGDAIKGQLQENGINWDSIKDDAKTMLRQTGKPELRPESIEGQVKDAGKDAQATAKGTAENPQATDSQFNDLMNRVFDRTSDVANAADRDALINVVAARTGKSKEDASKIVDRWEQTYQQAKAKYAEVKDQAEQKAREAGDAAARGVSHAATWTFLAMLAGLVASAFGGYLSTPPEHRHLRRPVDGQERKRGPAPR